MADLPKPLREGEVMGAYMDFDRTADKTWTSAEYLVRFGQFVSQRTADQLRAYAAAKVAEERKRAIQIIESYRVPAGNSSAGEMACEWTMEALREIRDAIRGTEAAS